MKMRFQLTIHFESLDDFAAVLCAVEQQVEDYPPVSEVGMIAEQVYTFDPTEEDMKDAGKD